MNCNHYRFLEQQILECRRIARSSNSGTQAEQEWLKTAEVLLDRRKEHLAVCEKCKQPQA